jgi:hypothetical protein
LEADFTDPMNNRQSTFYLLLILLLICMMAARTPLDSDLWWHLRAGQDSLRSGTPVLTDTYSLTRTGITWINHSWLSQVIFYMVYFYSGYWGLSALVTLLAAAGMGLVYYQMDGIPLIRSFLLVLGSLVAAVVWVPRPQMFSFFFIALIGWIVFHYRYHQRSWLWSLPIVFILWSNLHGGYPLGLGFLLLVLLGDVFNHLRCFRVEPLLPWKKIRRYGGIILVSSLVVILNPNGFKMWLVPFQTLDVGILRDFISEWASPDFHELFQQPFLWLLFLFIALASLGGKKIHLADLFLVIGFAYMGFLARRNFGPFALVSLPVISRLTPDFLRVISGEKEIHRNSDSKDVSLKGKSAVNLAIIALLAIIVIVKGYVTSHPVLVSFYEKQAYPVETVAWISINYPESKILNSYNWGGYLVWKLQTSRVFVDGRTDLYGDEILGEWSRIVNAESGWQNDLDRWAIDLVLIEPDRPLANYLQAAGWHLLYQDPVSVLYGR